jgi:hypothetical protein
MDDTALQGGDTSWYDGTAWQSGDSTWYENTAMRRGDLSWYDGTAWQCGDSTWYGACHRGLEHFADESWLEASAMNQSEAIWHEGTMHQDDAIWCEGDAWNSTAVDWQKGSTKGKGMTWASSSGSAWSSDYGAGDVWQSRGGDFMQTDNAAPVATVQYEVQTMQQSVPSLQQQAMQYEVQAMQQSVPFWQLPVNQDSVLLSAAVPVPDLPVPAAVVPLGNMQWLDLNQQLVNQITALTYEKRMFMAIMRRHGLGVSAVAAEEPDATTPAASSTGA